MKGQSTTINTEDFPKLTTRSSKGGSSRSSLHSRNSSASSLSTPLGSNIKSITIYPKPSGATSADTNMQRAKSGTSSHSHRPSHIRSTSLSNMDTSVDSASVASESQLAPDDQRSVISVVIDPPEGLRGRVAIGDLKDFEKGAKASLDYATWSRGNSVNIESETGPFTSQVAGNTSDTGADVGIEMVAGRRRKRSKRGRKPEEQYHAGLEQPQRSGTGDHQSYSNRDSQLKSTGKSSNQGKGKWKGASESSKRWTKDRGKLRATAPTGLVRKNEPIDIIMAAQHDIVTGLATSPGRALRPQDGVDTWIQRVTTYQGPGYIGKRDDGSDEEWNIRSSKLRPPWYELLSPDDQELEQMKKAFKGWSFKSRESYRTIV